MKIRGRVLDRLAYYNRCLVPMVIMHVLMRVMFSYNT